MRGALDLSDRKGKTMYLKNCDPRKQGKIDARLNEISRHGFEPVMSTEFGDDWFYLTRCKKCGHKIKANQMIYRFRHQMKCEVE